MYTSIDSADGMCCVVCVMCRLAAVGWLCHVANEAE